MKNSDKCGIYAIKNLLDGKNYIGSSKTINYRFCQHKRNLVKNKHVNPHLQNAWNKYGEENFVFEIWEECSQEELIRKEQLTIDKTRSFQRIHGYNICEVANKPTLTDEVKSKISKSLKGNIPWNCGIPHSDATKEKMRQRKLGIKGKNHPRFGKHVSDETKDKIRVGNLLYVKNNGAVRLGKKHTKKTKEKLRQSKLGTKLSDETKNKISASNKGRVCSEETKNKLKQTHLKQSKVIGQFLDDVLIAKFASISEAKRSTQIVKISECINGKRNNAGGYTWKLL